MLQQCRHLSSVRAMSITHSEEVAVSQAHDVRVGQVCILVHLEWVVSRDTTLCRKRELRDDVGELLSSVGLGLVSLLLRLLLQDWLQLLVLTCFVLVRRGGWRLVAPDRTMGHISRWHDIHWLSLLYALTTLETLWLLNWYLG